MNRNAGIVNKGTLGALLAVQLVVIGVLLAARSGGIEEPEPFLSFDADAVDSLSVSNSDGAVGMAKVDGAWQLPEGVPAASVKVDSVIDKLRESPGGWPVASTGSSRERFEVTQENHQRRIVLKAGEETVADIYLGTSPGFRKTHARRAGDGDVFAIAFSNYEAGVKASDWLEKSLLRPEGTLTGVRRVDAFELTRDEEGGWVSADGSELDQGKVETFVGRFKGLSATDLSDATLPEAATMAFALTDDEGVLTLSVYALEDGEKYVAVSDRVAGAYEVAKYVAEQMEKTLADLASDPPEDEAVDGSAGEESETQPPQTAQAAVAPEEPDTPDALEAPETGVVEEAQTPEADAGDGA